MLGIVLSAGSAAMGAGTLVALQEPGWPQFRGPRRDAVSAETGLRQSWPEGGPKLLWKATGIGRGYSQPIIVGDTLWITGDVGDECRIQALGLDGKPKWHAANGKAWKRSHAGARATCTYSDGRLYHMNAFGRAACLDPRDGREVWAVDVLERFAGKLIQWGISECLLVDGDRVIVTPGGKKALMAALDKKTGRTVWATEPLRFERTHVFGGKQIEPRQDVDNTGYASPILVAIGGRRLLVRTSAQHLFAVDADAGKLVWTKKVYARFEVVGSMPVFTGDGVFCTVSDVFGGQLFRIRASADAIEFEGTWKTDVDNCHGSFVFVDGRIYGSGYRKSKPWACLDVATGERKYQRKDIAIGSCLWADGRLYALSQAGILHLLEPTATAFEERGRIDVTGHRKGDCWAHPVVLDGRLYLRYHDTLWCYDIRRP